MTYTFNRQFPETRLRRLRYNDNVRAMIREVELHPKHFIAPVFVLEGNNKREAIASMPGVERLSIDLLINYAKELLAEGVTTIDIFPVIDNSLKTPDGKSAYDENGLSARAVKAVKDAVPEMVVMTDVALDPYTSHGQDGLLDDSGYVVNDETVEVLVKQALVHARAGADIISPSDMMDGRIKAMRDAFEAEGFVNTAIMSYSTKFASSFYGPFREAAGTALKGDRKTYQMNPMNRREAIRESLLDEAQGADCLMVKPAGAYLDILRDIRERTELPIGAYQVSGEYAMIKFAALAGAIDEEKVVLESLGSIKRAGADLIFSYFALDLAEKKILR